MAVLSVVLSSCRDYDWYVHRRAVCVGLGQNGHFHDFQEAHYLKTLLGTKFPFCTYEHDRESPTPNMGTVWRRLVSNMLWTVGPVVAPTPLTISMPNSSYSNTTRCNVLVLQSYSGDEEVDLLVKSSSFTPQ
eukprot:scaffold584_cov132-Cylindrotheca_fusiformis.AAC.9